MKFYSLLFALIVAILGLTAVVNARPTESQTKKSVIVQHKGDPCDSGKMRTLRASCKDSENPDIDCEMIIYLCAVPGEQYKLTMVQD